MACEQRKDGVPSDLGQSTVWKACSFYALQIWICGENSLADCILLPSCPNCCAYFSTGTANELLGLKMPPRKVVSMSKHGLEYG